jgi:hypothetical protein
MVTNTPIQTGKPRCIGRRGSQYVVGVYRLILAMVYIFTGFGISVVTAWSVAAPAVQIVDRSGKSERLAPALQFHRNSVNQSLDVKFSRTPAPDRKLTDGCEAASSLTHSPFARVAGRCVT